MVEGIKEHKTKAESTLDTINESETVKNIKKFWEWTRKKRKNLWICMIIKLKMLKFSQYITCRSRRFKSADTGIYEIQRSEGIVEGLMDKFLALKDLRSRLIFKGEA